jgi:hypothetical protein
VSSTTFQTHRGQRRARSDFAQHGDFAANGSTANQLQPVTRVRSAKKTIGYIRSGSLPSSIILAAETVLTPIHLLADSSLLFADGGALLRRLAKTIAAEKPSAAFIGAASGDDPHAYAIFEAAMDVAGIESRRHVGSRYSAMDHICLSAADLIVIGGGDPVRGLEVMKATDMFDTVVQRFLAGALLIGVSAGAMIIGEEIPGEPPVGAMNLVPFVVGVHDESEDFARLWRAVAEKPGRRGIGIPFGGGALFHRPNVLEPIGKPLVELVEVRGEVRRAVLLAGEGQS